VLEHHDLLLLLLLLLLQLLLLLLRVLLDYRCCAADTAAVAAAVAGCAAQPLTAYRLCSCYCTAVMVTTACSHTAICLHHITAQL
jgi:hypothetical protein